jgi:hypothetical protein
MTAITLNTTQLPIQTVAPSISIGEVMVSADKRSTKEKPLTDAERIRRVVLPAGHWQELTATINGERSQGLCDVLRDALRRIANDRLSDSLAEEPMRRTVELADYSVASLLAWSADTASSRGSIPFTREQVEAWFKSSATRTALLARWEAAGKDAAQRKQLEAFAEKRFCTLAAKNHGLKDETDAAKLLALMDEADAATGVGADVVGRIAHIQKAMAAKTADATISMDDL